MKVSADLKALESSLFVPYGQYLEDLTFIICLHRRLLANAVFLPLYDS
jgi:hypothetical protein